MATVEAVPTAKPIKVKGKAKGPIRWEAIVPFFVIVGLIILYFTLFFDTHLRKGLEWVGTHANGAEVDIDSLHTSFWKATLAIHKIEVTNGVEPKKNRAEIADVRFGLHWDALLRAKVVVDEASITGIETHTDRRSPGEVLPPAKEGSLASAAIGKMKEELGKTSLGDLGKFLEGFDPSAGLKNLGELKSAARIAQLRTELDQKEKQWTASLNQIPGQKDLAELQAKLKAIQVNGSPNPAEILTKVNDVNAIIKNGNAKVESVTNLGNALVQDVSNFSKSVAEVDNLAAQDRKDLESKLKIPSIEPKKLAMQLFGGVVLDKVGKIQRYIDTARSYMPAKKKATHTEKEKELVIQEREKGHNYEFGRPNSYPLFWLRLAKISSTGANSAFGGDVTGTLADVSSNPRLTGKPSVLQLKGEFPKQNIGGVLFRGEMDHSKEIPKESFVASVGSYPLGEQMLSQSDSLKFGFSKAQASAKLEGSFQGDAIDIGIANSFRQVDYLVSAESKLLESTLREVVKGVPSVDMKARLTGSWSNPDLSIDSNLGSALAQGLQKQLQAKIAEARAKIDALIQANIAKGKAELNARMNEVKGKVTSQVDERKKQALAFKSVGEAKLNEIKSKAPSPGGQAVDALKKKFPGF